MAYLLQLAGSGFTSGKRLHHANELRAGKDLALSCLSTFVFLRRVGGMVLTATPLSTTLATKDGEDKQLIAQAQARYRRQGWLPS